MARRRDRLAGKRLEPFGATQKRGKQYEKERKLKNRIHELEQELAGNLTALANLNASKVDAERKARDAQPTENQLNALRRIAHVPLTKIVELKLEAPALVIAEWVLALERSRQ